MRSHNIKILKLIKKEKIVTSSEVAKFLKVLSLDSSRSCFLYGGSVGDKPFVKSVNNLHKSRAHFVSNICGNDILVNKNLVVLESCFVDFMKLLEVG